MFSQACVTNSVREGAYKGVSVLGEGGGMRGEGGCVFPWACIAGGLHGKGGAYMAKGRHKCGKRGPTWQGHMWQKGPYLVKGGHA